MPVRKYLNVIFLIVFLIHLSKSSLDAQSNEENYPIVGRVCPDFYLNEIDYYSKNHARLQDFRSKWLVLDFWTKGCVSCVQSFPKINRLQDEFKDEIQFLLVAKNDLKFNKGIKQMFERFRLQQNLKLSIAYDSLLFKQFGVQIVPHIVIVDPSGIVRAVTYSEDVNSGNLKALLTGAMPFFKAKDNVFQASQMRHISMDSIFSDNHVLKEVNELNDFRYKSELSAWNRDMPIWIATRIQNERSRWRFNATAMSLLRLYNIAYLGRTDWPIGDSLYFSFWRYPILELKDSSAFDCDFMTGRGYYNYSLIVPKAVASKAYMQWAMQCDLKKYFQFDVAIEKRMMPHWKLGASPKCNLQTTGGPSSIKGDHSGYVFRNVSVDEILKVIWSYHQTEPPFIDSTGIMGNIDISIHAIMTDLNDLRCVLTESGLTLILDKREISVVVIKDPAMKF